VKSKKRNLWFERTNGQRKKGGSPEQHKNCNAGTLESPITYDFHKKTTPAAGKVASIKEKKK